MSDNPVTLLREVRTIVEQQISLFGPVVISNPDDSDSMHPNKLAASGAVTAIASPDSINMQSTGQQPVEPEPTNRQQTGKPVERSPYERISALVKPNSPMAGMNSLDELKSYVEQTVLIPLDKTRIKPVFGVGNPDADLMIVGEAPGADEDRQGEPFVGRAGKLLTQIIGAIGFARSDVYIANILKSRPPDNRRPEPDEVHAHIPILYRQIALIKPKLLLCVGKTAGTSLLNMNTSLKELRGTFHDYHGLPVLVTYHPAALLRNSNWKRPTWEDVQLLRKRYDELGGRTPIGPDSES